MFWKVFLSLLRVGTRSIISWQYPMDAEEVFVMWGWQITRSLFSTRRLLFLVCWSFSCHLWFHTFITWASVSVSGNDTQHSCYFSLRVLFYLQSFLFDWSVLSLVIIYHRRLWSMLSLSHCWQHCYSYQCYLKYIQQCCVFITKWNTKLWSSCNSELRLSPTQHHNFKM